MRRCHVVEEYVLVANVYAQRTQVAVPLGKCTQTEGPTSVLLQRMKRVSITTSVTHAESRRVRRSVTRMWLRIKVRLGRANAPVMLVVGRMEAPANCATHVRSQRRSGVQRRFKAPLEGRNGRPSTVRTHRCRVAVEYGRKMPAMAISLPRRYAAFTVSCSSQQ